MGRQLDSEPRDFDPLVEEASTLEQKCQAKTQSDLKLSKLQNLLE